MVTSRALCLLIRGWSFGWRVDSSLRLRLAGGELLAEEELLDFAGCGEREGVGEHPLARDLVRGQVLAAIGREFLLGGGAAGGGLDEGGHLLAPMVVGHAHHGHVADRGMGVQDLLDLPGVYVLAAAYYHLLEATLDPEVPALIC